MDAKGVSYVLQRGEAAFYGPKADFMAKDVLGREWQLSTIQVDFIQPERLGLRVHRRRRTAAHAGRHPPRRDWQHRALHGSPYRALQRSVPGLAPVQAVVIPIADRHVEVR